MIILGVDPGTRATGYGVVEIEGSKETVIEYGVLRLDPEDAQPLRLKQIFERLTDVIARHLPDECAVEMPVYGKNPQSMLKLGRAQAAAMLAALTREVPITQYTPSEVKKAVTGKGNADKMQVMFMVRRLLGVTDADPPLTHDASDALAVALCHAHRRSGGHQPTAYKGWGDFLAANPDRVVK